MENKEKKKDILWWAVLVAIILWVVFKWPMFVFGIAIFVGIWKWLGLSDDLRSKSEDIEEKDDDSTAGDENEENPAAREEKSDSS